MAWFKCGGGGIPSSLKSDMNDVFNKKFGTVLQNYPPEEWPGTVNLMGPLPERTVSGSIVSFSDGADDVSIKNCIATVDANLSGVSSVIIRKNQKNFFDKSNSNLQAYYVDTNGVFNESSSYARSIVIFLQKGTYTITRTIPQGASNNRFRIALYNDVPVNGSTGNLLFNSNEALTATVTIPTFGYLAIFVCNSQAYLDNIQAVLDSFQIELGEVSSTFESYMGETYTAALGRTIYGGSVDVVNGTGTDENGNDFTFTPITPTPETALGVNNFWADTGDSSVTYRRDIDLALAQ